MPFLCVFPKQARTAPPDDAAVASRTLARLAELLCPYRGEVQRIAIPGGALYLSSLADVSAGAVAEATSCVIPRGTRKNASSAWLEITIDQGEVRFETDPLGTFPLWCYEDDSRIVVTGEVKGLTALPRADVGFDPDASLDMPRRPPDFSPYRNVRRVFPGAVLRVARSLERIEERRPALVFRPASMLAADEERKSLLDRALLGSAAAIGGEEGGWGTFLSGGIDSSLATSLMKRAHPDLQTFTLGTELGDEYADAEALASRVGATHTRVFASEADALAHFERAVFCNETMDGLSAETVAQLSILAQTAARSVRHIVTGYGADLLFGSMLRHELYMRVTGVDDLQSLIERTCWSGEFAPFFAWSLGIQVHHLFWDPQVMNCAFRIPPEASFDGSPGCEEKLVLRNMAVERGYMDHAHAHRKKQAMTDGTQFNRLLSTAFRLRDGYSYDQKSAHCVSRLRRVFEPETGRP